MNRVSAKVGLAFLVAGVPILLAGLVANLAALPGTASGSQSAPPQVVPPTSVVFVQSLLAPAADPRVLIALGIAAALGAAFLVWRKRNKEVQAKFSSPLVLFLALASLVLVLSGLSLVAKSGSETEPVVPQIVGGWAKSVGSYTSTLSGSYAVFALIAAATLGILLFASMYTITRAAPNLLRAKTQTQPLPEPAVPARKARLLELGSGPRGTVVRSYWEISDELQRRAKLDASSLTVREFESLVGTGLKSAKGFLHEATALFEKARYSEYPISEAEANRSLICLENLVPGAGGAGREGLPIGGAER
jgi:hypothetical protein